MIPYLIKCESICHLTLENRPLKFVGCVQAGWPNFFSFLGSVIEFNCNLSNFRPACLWDVGAARLDTQLACF